MVAILLALVLQAAQERTVDPAAELAAARSLYASAAYEDALDRLTRIGAPEALADQIDTYRALCLLALGRTNESERVLEQILVRNPRYSLDDAEVSPRLVAAIRDVRSRVLPAAARNLYAAARADFDQGHYDTAVFQLRELLVLISPENVPVGAAGLSDLRILSEGFLKLAESMIVSPQPQRPAPPAASSLSPPGTASAAPGAPVFSIANREVMAPVEISRQVPAWDAPKGTPSGTYQGVVEVVIDELGRVESASIKRSVAPSYDAVLLQATNSWRFQPASKDGLPVKYRRSYEVIVHSSR